MKTQAGFVSSWRIAKVGVDGAAAAITLMSGDLHERPKVNDAAIVSYVDPSSGVQHVLPYGIVVAPGPSPQPITNGDFSAWTPGLERLPVAWARGDDQTASLWAEPILGAQSGARISVVASPTQAGVATRFVSLAQSVRLTTTRLRIRIRPFQDCRVTERRRPSVQALAGISATDGNGRRAIFCIASLRGRAVRRITIDGTTIVLVRGHIGSWNDEVLDLRSAWPQLVINAAKPSTLTLGVTAAIPELPGDQPWVALDIGSIAAAT